MARPRGSRFRGQSPRLTTWAEGPFGAVTLTSGTSTVMMGTSIQAIADGLTLIRVRGEMLLSLTNVAAALDGFTRIACGLCIVSENAAGIGATAIPSPADDMEWNGWLWHWTGAVFTPGDITASGFVGNGSLGVRVPIDSKSMRKFKATDVLVGMIQPGNEVGTSTLRCTYNSRILLKLP